MQVHHYVAHAAVKSDLLKVSHVRCGFFLVAYNDGKASSALLFELWMPA